MSYGEFSDCEWHFMMHLRSQRLFVDSYLAVRVFHIAFWRRDYKCVDIKGTSSVHFMCRLCVFRYLFVCLDALFDIWLISLAGIVGVNRNGKAGN